MSFAAANRAKSAVARKKSTTSVVAKAARATVSTPPFPIAANSAGVLTSMGDEPLMTLEDDEPTTLDALAIPLELIVRSPHNTRKTFPQESLDELAASLKSVGQTTMCEVLPAFGGKYELVDGERRYRAAIIAGLKTLRCCVRDVGSGSPAEIDLVRFEANRHRESLNPIDEAKAFDHFLKPKAEGGHGMSQADLAKRVGVSASQISNRVRLLRLPQRFQEAVISAEMPVENARTLAAWCDVPSVAKALQKAKPIQLGETWEVRQLIRGATFSLGGLDKKVIEKHREALKPREFKDGLSSVLLATGDLDLARRLSEEQQQKNVAKWNKKTDRDNKKTAQLSDEEAQKRKAQTYNKKLFRYVAEWHKLALLTRLETPEKIGEQILWRWVLFFATCRDGASSREGDVNRALKVKGGGDDFFAARLAKQLPKLEVAEHLPGLLTEWFAVNFESYQAAVKPWEMIVFANQAGIAIEVDWRLDDAFIGLHNTQQLSGLWKELGLQDETQTSIPPTAKRSFATEKFAAAIAADKGKKRPFPKCLKTVEPVSLT